MTNINGGNNFIKFGKQQVELNKSDGVKRETVVGQDDKENSITNALFKRFDTNNDNILDNIELGVAYDYIKNAAKNGTMSNAEAKKLAQELGVNVTRDDIKQFAETLANENDGVSASWEGNKYTVKDGNKTTITEYADDAHTQPAKITVKEGNKTTVTEMNGNQKTVTTTIGTGDNVVSTTVETFDGDKPTSKTVTRGAVTTEYEYDESGNVSKEVTTNQDGTTITKEGEKTTTVSPDGKTVIDEGNTHTEILASGREITTVTGENGEKTVTVKDGDNTAELKYDEQGNILSNAKKGESFEQTARRLGIEPNTPEYNQFKELNAQAANKGWFQVGAEVKIPAGMEDKIKIDDINVDAKAEKQKFHQEALNNTDVSMYNDTNTQKTTLDKNTTWFELAKQNLIDGGNQNPSKAEISKRALELQKLNNGKNPVRGTEITLPGTATAPTGLAESTETAAPTEAAAPLPVHVDKYIQVVLSNVSIDDLMPKTGAEVAQSLYDDVRAFGGTGKDFDKHIKQITADNVIEILNTYDDKSKHESLAEAIFDEVGLSMNKRIESVNHIKDALIARSQQLGVDVTILNSQFESEVDNATTGALASIGYVDTDNLDRIINTYKERIQTMGSLSAAARQKYMDELGFTTYTTEQLDIVGQMADVSGITNKSDLTGDGTLSTNGKQMTGNCWAHAGLNSMLATPQGAEIVNNLITKKNGVISVKIPEAANKGLPQPKGDGIYTFSEQDLTDGFVNQSMGDGDVTALMLAINQYFEDAGLKDGLANRMDGNYGARMFEILTGQKFENFHYSIPDGIGCTCGVSDRLYNNMKELLENGAGAITVSFKDGTTDTSVSAQFQTLQGGITDGNALISDGHAYSVQRMDDNNVYLIESNNPDKIIVLSKADFEQIALVIATLKY